MRYWNNQKIDDGSIHCLGNGKMAVYEQGPQIIQVFGPPYSSPSYMQMLVCGSLPIESESARKHGTAIWTHEISTGKQAIGQIVDFVANDNPALIRKITLESPIDLSLKIDSQINVTKNGERYASDGIKWGVLTTAEAGTYIYNRYPSPKRLSHQIIVKGNVQVDNELVDNEWTIHCLPGESFIYIIGGPSYPKCIQNTEDILSREWSVVLEDTKQYWMDFTSRRKNFDQLLPEHLPGREFLLSTIDSVSVLIKTQQAEDGGVLAGHNYHMAYVRDQYGVSRCLLTLGYLDEARAILDFYWNIWKRHGRIHNAQTMGVDGIFHIHENDEVEITSYLIIQAFDYYRSSKDQEYINTILPMLIWALEVQLKHLEGYMLPFNGDETYVAGGILPRSTLNDGSAEATMLFITAGRRLLEWIAKSNLCDLDRIDEYKGLLEETENQYFKNFWAERGLYTNSPKRKQSAFPPRFRHGVCEGCYKKNRPMYFGWTERNKGGWYLCPVCYSDNDWDSVPEDRYILQSVSLMPLYINAEFIETNKIKEVVNNIIEQYQINGNLPSRPEGNRSVGYDYGLLLYNLVKLDHPLAQRIYNNMMGILDSTGSWVEYYEYGQPMGTRCRPWESGINLEAAIYYATHYSSEHNV